MNKTLLVVFITLLLTGSAIAQNAEITGTVRDAETKEILANANVKYEKGKAVLSDASGKYKISLPAGEYDLVINYTGYKAEKQKVVLTAGEKKVIDVELTSSAIQVNDVVTVSQYKKNAAYETVTVEVVGKTQLQHTNANDLGEAVNKVPGVLVQDGQISIRSGSAFSYGVGSRTAVLVDGLNFTSADLGEAQFKSVPLENVKQIEVVKGPASALFGSAALNGGVNIITEWPSQTEPKTEIDINVGVSDRPKLDYQTWWKRGKQLRAFTNDNINYQQRIKDIQLIVYGNVTYIKGALEFSDELRGRVGFKLRRLDPKITGLNYGIGANIMTEKSERFFISKDLDSSIYRIGSGSDDQYIRSNIDPFVTYTTAKGHRISGAFRYMNIFRKGNGEDANSVSHQIMGDVQYQYKWKNMLTVTAGVPFNVGLSSSNLYPGFRRNFTTAIYTQLEFKYKILTVQGGVRYEVAGLDTDIISNKPVFRTGVSVQAAKATFLRASWGQGYRVPASGEKYISATFAGSIPIIPNDTLRPESGWGMEFGIKQGFKIGKWAAYVDASVFWQEYKDFIEFQIGLWPNRDSKGNQLFPDSLEFPSAGSGKLLGLQAHNVANTRIAGYELSITGKGKIGPVGVQILAGYTYTWPTRNDIDTAGNHTYKVGEYIQDLFKYSFKRVEHGNPDSTKLLYNIRHLVRADIELTYWKCYLGATFNFVSTPEVIPPLFRTASNVLFHDLYALDRFHDAHSPGDFFMDMRAGINVNKHIRIGFIVKNVTNKLYALRPGKPEAPRNYTLQFKYTF